MLGSRSSPANVTCRDVVAYCEQDADRTVVWVAGEHDLSTIAALSEALARAIALDDADIVIDLSGVQFMDAAVAGVLIRARDFLHPRSRALQVRQPSTRARRVIELCGLNDLVELCSSDPPPLGHGPLTNVGAREWA